MIHARSAIWLAIAGGLCWVLLLAPLPPPLLEGRGWALPLVGVFVQFLIVATLIQHSTGVASPPGRWDGSIAVALAGAALLAAVALRKIEILPALLLFLCGSALLLLVIAVIEQMRAGRSVELISHSGGLGGSVGGWKISSVAVIVMLILLLVGTIITLAPDGSGEVARNSGRTTDSGNSVATARPQGAPAPRPGAAASGTVVGPVAAPATSATSPVPNPALAPPAGAARPAGT